MPARAELKGQEWERVRFAAAPAAAARPPTQRPALTHAQKLDRETEELSHPSVSKELRLALSRARLAKGLTQRSLASQLSLPPTTISDYEGGRAIPDNALIARIERHLGVKLPRAKK